VWTARPELERQLGPTASWEALTDEVSVYSAGSGRWRDGTLLWSEGELRVSVTPDQGAHLRILTPEAVIEVQGTVFRVSRDAFGTQVATERGQVSVTCVGGPRSAWGTGPSGCACAARTPGWAT
jgi:hypothetical protein